mgnify:CR=1 FL=1
MIRSQTALSFPWSPPDPFLFTAHHVDHYPRGNDVLAPDAPLDGRKLGMDFAGKDGWRMYHGHVVPGFPQHPHRGFETVTIATRGVIDHSDSLGAAARFGDGDVQWITAGRGISHSEMFPLLRKDADNPVELFQIWLNLPASDKLAEPHFEMFWADRVPRVVEGGASVTVVAGAFGDARPPSPPPRSWAARADSDVAIWLVRLEPSATIGLPKAQPTSNRSLFFHRGQALRVGDEIVRRPSQLAVDPGVALPLANHGDDVVELLVLQGKPIDEPIAQYGPFVMNTPTEIRQAFSDYERTRFGGWPWPSDDPVHARDVGRWARWPDGHEERSSSS